MVSERKLSSKHYWASIRFQRVANPSTSTQSHSSNMLRPLRILDESRYHWRPDHQPIDFTKCSSFFAPSNSNSSLTNCGKVVVSISHYIFLVNLAIRSSVKNACELA